MDTNELSMSTAYPEKFSERYLKPSIFLCLTCQQGLWHDPLEKQSMHLCTLYPPEENTAFTD